MVYKRYIKRGGKLCGPYYYKSYRDKNGKVVSKFVSGPTNSDRVVRKFNPKLNKKLKKGLQISALVFVFCLVMGLFFIGTTQLNNTIKTSGFAVFQQESVVEEFRNTRIRPLVKAAVGEHFRLEQVNALVVGNRLVPQNPEAGDEDENRAGRGH